MTSGIGPDVSSKEQKSHFLWLSRRTALCGPVREKLCHNFSPISPAIAQNMIHNYISNQ